MEIDLELEKQCDAIIAEYPKKKSAAMMIMHLVQEKFGHFDDSTINFVAKKLGVEPIEVYGMLTFYPMYSQQPRGRIHIKVCRTLSCALAGSIKLGNEISRFTGCPMGETRGVYTIEFVECLGNCVKAPNVQVNDKLFDEIRRRTPKSLWKRFRRSTSAASSTRNPPGPKPQGAGDFNSAAYKG